MGNPEEKRKELLDYFHQTFDIDEQLFEVFADQQAMYSKADPLRHPLIFYYGHTATFYINKLIISKILNERINPGSNRCLQLVLMRCRGRSEYKSLRLPTVAEVTEYRNKVRQTIDELIKTLPLQLPVGWITLSGLS